MKSDSVPMETIQHGDALQRSEQPARHSGQNITIMRAFVQLRAMLSTHTDLARKLEELETKYDAQFRVVFDAIRQLVTPPEPNRKRIGFVREKRAVYRVKRKGKE